MPATPIKATKNRGGGMIPRLKSIPESPIPPGTWAAPPGKYGAIVASHHCEGEARMKGRLGPMKPETAIPAPTIVFLSFEEGDLDSCQRRMRRNGIAMSAICFVAPANPTIRRLRFRFLYHRIAPPTRKNAQTLSVQLAATNAGKKTKGARLSAF